MENIDIAKRIIKGIILHTKMIGVKSFGVNSKIQLKHSSIGNELKYLKPHIKWISTSSNADDGVRSPMIVKIPANNGKDHI